MIIKTIYKGVGIEILATTLFISLSVSCGREKDETFELVVNNPQIRISHIRERAIDSCMYNCAVVKYKLINNSSSNILLYDFNSYFEFGEVNPKLLCDSLTWSAEKIIYLFKDSGEQVKPAGSIPDSINYKPEALRRYFQFARIWFRNSQQVIRSGETIEFSQNVNFRDFYLIRPGTYQLKILYIQNDVSNYVTQEELEEDLKKHDAYLFKGCLWSQPVELVVE